MLVPFVHLKRFLSELGFPVAPVVTLATSLSRLVAMLELGLMYSKPGGSGWSPSAAWTCRTQVSPEPHRAGASQLENLAGPFHVQSKDEVPHGQRVSPGHLRVQPSNKELTSQYRPAGIVWEESVISGGKSGTKQKLKRNQAHMATDEPQYGLVTSFHFSLPPAPQKRAGRNFSFAVLGKMFCYFFLKYCMPSG